MKHTTGEQSIAVLHTVSFRKRNKMDQAPASPFPTAQAFEEEAAVVDDNGVQSYVPGRFVTRTGQRVSEMPLDTLTSVLMRMVTSLPSFQEEKDLGPMTVSAIALDTTPNLTGRNEDPPLRNRSGF